MMSSLFKMQKKLFMNPWKEINKKHKYWEILKHKATIWDSNRGGCTLAVLSSPCDHWTGQVAACSFRFFGFRYQFRFRFGSRFRNSIRTGSFPVGQFRVLWKLFEASIFWWNFGTRFLPASSSSSRVCRKSWRWPGSRFSWRHRRGSAWRHQIRNLS